MPLPTHVAEAVDTLLDGPPPEGEYADGHACQGARFHSPTPLVLTRVWITPEPLESARDSNVLQVMLCPTCAANLRVLQRLLVATKGELPWKVRREFGNDLRLLAMKGWERFTRGGTDG